MANRNEPRPDHPCDVVQRRPADVVMRLERLGSLHQSRLSFMRILTRRLQNDNWTITHKTFCIDETGVGYATYSIAGPHNTYTLVAFAHDLPPEQRSDRVIATAWDATFTLYDGIPSEADISRLAANVPFQEAGRISSTELTLARANRSVRLWEHVVTALAMGKQPDKQQIESVGYLMRTTAVYGSGKFGATDRQAVADRPEFSVPFQAEMLTVYLIRTFVRDLVQHMATVQGGPTTAQLEPDLARRLGIGNSTGLGMAPFLVNHPQLFNNWITVREEALVRVRSLESVSLPDWEVFKDLLARTRLSVDTWHSAHPLQTEKIQQLTVDLASLDTHLRQVEPHTQWLWDRLYEWSVSVLGVEAQECLVSLMMEPYADLIDDLDGCMSAPDGTLPINGSMPVNQLRQLIEEHYPWALKLDWDTREQCARAWYVSEEKLEPRLGERFEEPIEAFEQPLAPARDVCRLHAALVSFDAETVCAEFLLRHPEHRHAVRRAQLINQAPYAEIRDNTISASLVPFDMLRCKLAFFGATHFDPRSDRWLRICLYANAPYPDEISSRDADTWIYPPLH